jgi:thiamine-phosphate pyrophosphorylase
MGVAPRRLLALTPGTHSGEAGLERLLESLRRAFEAGLPAVLLREPLLDDAAFSELAQRTVRLARRFEGRWVGVHDRVHAALSAGADGVHLGFRSLPPACVRELVGEDLCVGFSAHAADDLETWAGADYLTFGPFRDTPSKRGLQEPTGLPGLRAAVARARVPVFALGGVRPGDLPALGAAGAAGAAVLSGIWGAADSGAATSAYLCAGTRGEAGCV